MRKLVLGLAMVTVVMGLVGCGTTDDKKDGFVPEQVTETPDGTENVLIDEVKEDIEEIANGDLTKYYNTEKIVGVPRVEVVKTGSVWQFPGGAENTIHFHAISNEMAYRGYDIAWTDNLELMTEYTIIITDNNTPNDYTDDIIAYIFTE